MRSHEMSQRYIIREMEWSNHSHLVWEIKIDHLEKHINFLHVNLSISTILMEESHIFQFTTTIWNQYQSLLVIEDGNIFRTSNRFFRIWQRRQHSANSCWSVSRMSWGNESLLTELRMSETRRWSSVLSSVESNSIYACSVIHFFMSWRLILVSIIPCSFFSPSIPSVRSYLSFKNRNFVLAFQNLFTFATEKLYSCWSFQDF